MTDCLTESVGPFELPNLLRTVFFGGFFDMLLDCFTFLEALNGKYELLSVEPNTLVGSLKTNSDVSIHENDGATHSLQQGRPNMLPVSCICNLSMLILESTS